MKKKILVSSIALALVVTTSISAYLLVNSNQKESDLEKQVIDLTTKNAELVTLRNSNAQFMVNNQKEKSDLTIEIFKELDEIDTYQNRILTSGWATENLVKVLGDELMTQRRELSKIGLALQNQDLPKDFYINADKKIKSIHDFIVFAQQKFDEVENREFKDLIYLNGGISQLDSREEQAQKLKNLDAAIKTHKGIVYAMALANQLESLKESSGSKTLPLCESLKTDSKIIVTELDRLDTNMKKFNDNLLSKPWISSMGKLATRDTYTYNMKNTSMFISANIYASSVDSNYDLGMACESFGQIKNVLIDANTRLDNVMKDVDNIEPKADVLMKNFCKTVKEDECKDSIDGVSTIVAVESFKFPFPSQNLDKRLDDAVIKYIKDRDMIKRQIQQNSANQLPQRGVTTQPSTQPSMPPQGNNQIGKQYYVPLGQNQGVEYK